MMRYHRVSPDCLPLSNGRKSNLRTCKEENEDNGRISNSNNFEGKSLRFRSGATPSNSHDQNFPNFSISDSSQSDSHVTPKTQNLRTERSSPSHGGDVLLQWGQRKRCRGSRAENRTVTDECSTQSRQMIKIHRKVGPGMDKQPLMNQTATMPPPSSPCNTTSYSRGGNLRPCMPGRESTGSLPNRNMEDRQRLGNGNPPSNGSSGSCGSQIVSRSVDKRSPSSPGKREKMVSSSRKGGTVEKKDASVVQADSTPVPSEKEAGATPTVIAGGEKVNLDSFEWPRIYISLSRKEKEDDFLAMKGTKLPQRPKKRAKNIDKTLQYCFPGMWLSDLTRGRYEVREKKCVKKQKRRGLKGMESMDSDSE